MSNRFSYFFLLCGFFLIVLPSTGAAQTILDSAGRPVEIPVAAVSKKDDSARFRHSPRKAAIRSAVLPGWGQAYNKKYWKIPIVYGALGASGGYFVYNLNWYKRFRFAYKTLYNRDTANYANVHPQLQVYVQRGDATNLQYQRDEFRRNIDYSVLFFLLIWGLNVVDATVDAHLKSFDVSRDLSLRLKPGFNAVTQTPGISLVLTFK